MELITTNRGEVCTIINVGATPVVPVRKPGDEIVLEGKHYVFTGELEDHTTWFELETVRHDSQGTVYLNEERGVNRLYTVVEKVESSLYRAQVRHVGERIA